MCMKAIIYQQDSTLYLSSSDNMVNGADSTLTQYGTFNKSV